MIQEVAENRRGVVFKNMVKRKEGCMQIELEEIKVNIKLKITPAKNKRK